jgi:hypothetical protein
MLESDTQLYDRHYLVEDNTFTSHKTLWTISLYPFEKSYLDIEPNFFFLEVHYPIRLLHSL